MTHLKVLTGALPFCSCCTWQWQWQRCGGVGDRASRACLLVDGVCACGQRGSLLDAVVARRLASGGGDATTNGCGAGGFVAAWVFCVGADV